MNHDDKVGHAGWLDDLDELDRHELIEQITVDAYGDVDTDAFELVPYDAFPADVDLEEGMGLRMVDESTGGQVEAYISELTDDGALLDMNHPLAGETLHFDVEIVGLRRATTDEIAHGHAHNPDHTH